MYQVDSSDCCGFTYDPTFESIKDAEAFILDAHREQVAIYKRMASDKSECELFRKFAASILGSFIEYTVWHRVDGKVNVVETMSLCVA